MTIRNLDAFFDPRCIVLLGASRRAGSVGALVAENLLHSGFRGRVLLVNPKGGEISGQPVYPDLAALPERPDLAVIATPADAVPGLIAELGELGCRAAVVISAGFEGEGPPAQLKQATLDAAQPHLLRIIGPNCLGLISPGAGLNASFARRMPPAGRVALVAQSGAVAAAAMESAAELGFGFSHVVTVGDCADVDVADLLDWLALDRRTDAILLYVEGLSAARKFMSAARVAARLKPVAVLKAGRSASGARAALSHTGALAGAFAVYEAAFRRAGLLQVDDLSDLLQAGAAFAAQLETAGDRLAILTNGGGAGVLALDALDLLGEQACELSPATLAALDRVAPANWSKGDPVDILGDAGAETYAAALKILLEAPEVDAVMALNCPTAVTDSVQVATALADVVRTGADKPVITAWLGGAGMAEARGVASAAGLPAYATPEEAARVYALLARSHRNRQLLVHAPDGAAAPAPQRATARALIERALAEGRTVLTDPESRELLRAYGVPVLESREVRTPEEAGAAALAFGAPVALKILSRQISHKTDVGGVALNLASAEATAAAARRMLEAVTTRRPDALIDGWVVEPMISRPEAQEILAGVVQDPTFGPVVLVGQGGIAVEVIADRALGLPPLNPALAQEMVSRTRVARLLAGFRGRRPADLPALGGVLVALSQLASELPEIAELDINPLLCDADGVLALDARVRLSACAAASQMAIQPYPAELEREVELGGGQLLLRPIRPEDAAALEAMVAACTPLDLRFRFGASLRRLWPELVAGLTQIDYDREMALVLQHPSGALLGVGRLCADPAGEAAEFALIVRSDQQGRGFGGLLLRALVSYAQSRGLSRVWGDTERQNQNMIELARELGFEIGAGDDDRSLLLSLNLRAPPFARPPHPGTSAA